MNIQFCFYRTHPLLWGSSLFLKIRNTKLFQKKFSCEADSAKGVFGGPSGPSQEGPGVGLKNSVGHKTDDKKREKKEKK